MDLSMIPNQLQEPQSSLLAQIVQKSSKLEGASKLQYLCEMIITTAEIDDQVIQIIQYCWNIGRSVCYSIEEKGLL